MVEKNEYTVSSYSKVMGLTVDEIQKRHNIKVERIYGNSMGIGAGIKPNGSMKIEKGKSISISGHDSDIEKFCKGNGFPHSLLSLKIDNILI